MAAVASEMRRLQTPEEEAPPPESVGSVQESSWLARNERYDRMANIAECWQDGGTFVEEVAKAIQSQPEVPVPRSPVISQRPPAEIRRMRRDRWPTKWPSRAKRDDGSTAAPAKPVHRKVRVPLPSEAATSLVGNGRAAGLAAWSRRLIDSHQLEGSFYVVDVSAAERLYRAWAAALPRVRAHYAVKCFPNARVIAALGALGCGFDCASEWEARLVTESLELPASGVIFANPCKRDGDLRAIELLGIKRATFDSPDELAKVAALCPDCGMLLRIRCDDTEARLPFGTKYGALEHEVRPLLQTAKALGVTVTGFAFHVGSGARSATAYRTAMEAAKRGFVELFDVFPGLALPPTPEDGAVEPRKQQHALCLDIGGGFAGGFGDEGHAFLSTSGDESVSAVINAALDDLYFNDERFARLEVIAEPGRYFAEASAALCTRIVGERHRYSDLGVHYREYWMTDGVYGGFNALIYDSWLPHAVLVPKAPGGTTPPVTTSSPGLGDQTLPPPPTDMTTKATTGTGVDMTAVTTIFGPTCDSLDVVFSKLRDAPPLTVADWLLFPCCGAYTLAGATDFNGMPATEAGGVHIFYVRSESMSLTETDRSLKVLYSKEPPMELIRNFNRVIVP